MSTLTDPLNLRPAYPPIRRVTTGATPLAVIFVPVKPGQAIELDVSVIVTRRSTGNSSHFRRILRAKNVGGTITIPSFTGLPDDDNPLGYAVTAEDTTGGVNLLVTGIAAQTADWIIHPNHLTA